MLFLCVSLLANTLSNSLRDAATGIKILVTRLLPNTAEKPCHTAISLVTPERVRHSRHQLIPNTKWNAGVHREVVQDLMEF